MSVDELAVAVRTIVTTLLDSPTSNFTLDTRRELQDCKSVLDDLIEPKKEHGSAKTSHETTSSVHGADKPKS